MTKKQKMVPLKDLNLTSRFLFAQVMDDPQTHQDVLSIIFGRDIPLLEKNETEKEGRLSPLAKTIRMDVFAMDEESTVYNTEMQQHPENDLAKRSRYYQSMIDMTLLKPGDPNYNLLNQSYIIMIMTFDLFGYKRYQYTFEAKCLEEPECELRDGATRIFLNTKGTNDNEVSRELVEFLHYVENTSDSEAEKSESERIKRIHDQVRRVKSSEEIGGKYVQAWEEKCYEREAGRQEGRQEGERNKLRKLVMKKLAKGKNAEEIADALEESVETIQELMEEIANEE